MINMKTKAEIEAWMRELFIGAGLCSDVPPPEEETRLFPVYPEGMTLEEQAEALEIIRNVALARHRLSAARDFLAKLNPPVDPIIKEAREACAASSDDPFNKERYFSGDWDDCSRMQAVIYALRQRDKKGTTNDQE